jgi:DNA repair exonuclease SbcCD nuclease subunit
MRIAVFGDRHISRRHPAYAEALRMWDYAITDAIDQGVEGFIGLGDALEVGTDLEEVYEISRRFSRMLDQGWVFEVEGNHEPRAGMRWITMLSKQRCTVADAEIRMEVVGDAAAEVVGGAVAFLLVPYCRRGHPPYHQVQGETLAEFYQNAGTHLGDLIGRAKAAMSVPLIVCGHWTPAGFRVSPSEFEQTAGKEMVVPVEALAPADLVLVGHIHEAQEVGNVVGVGSMFRTTFAERGQTKSYVILTIAEGQVRWERRVLPTRPMREVRISGQQTLETVAAILAEGEDQDVKVIIEAAADDRTVYADSLAILDGLAGRFPWEVVRPTHVAARAPEIERSTTLREDFEVWLPLTYPQLTAERRAGVLEKVEAL